jgi:hypothetical protein
MWAPRWVMTVGFLVGCGSGGGEPSVANDASSIPSGSDGSQQDATGPGSANDGAFPSDAGSRPETGSGFDGSAASFTDPNPLPCVGTDAGALCLVGWPDTNHTFTGCCLTSFVQDSQGKCGVSSGSSACFERKAPGNPDSTCMGGTFNVNFGSFQVGGSGVPGCCQWRTGTCGVVGDDLGCIDHAETFFRGMPCTPDYTNGSQYP